ncbi:hypothetical protein GCM10027451_29280 [Geodermatophilus aquaeductus]
MREGNHLARESRCTRLREAGGQRALEWQRHTTRIVREVIVQSMGDSNSARPARKVLLNHPFNNGKHGGYKATPECQLQGCGNAADNVNDQDQCGYLYGLRNGVHDCLCLSQPRVHPQFIPPRHGNYGDGGDPQRPYGGGGPQLSNTRKN